MPLFCTIFPYRNARIKFCRFYKLPESLVVSRNWIQSPLLLNTYIVEAFYKINVLSYEQGVIGIGTCEESMAAGDGQRSRLRLVIVITVLSLLLLAPFTIYYLWRSPYLYTKGLVFTPSPTLDLNCINNKCNCPVMNGIIDYTRCPLEQAFAVYVYRQNDVALQYPIVT